MNIQEFRKKYPQYNDIDDQQLADRLYNKYYSDMDRAEFNNRFLIPQQQPMGLLEQFGRGMTKQLPLAGLLFGGGGGAILGGPPGALIGGTTMTGAGQAAKRLIETAMGWEEPKPLSEEYYDIGLEMKRGAEAEMAGGIAGPLLGKMVSGARRAAPGVRELFREGFPVTRGAAVEKLAQKIPPGSWWFRRWGRKLNEMIQQANQQFQRERLALPSTITPKPSIEETQAAWAAWLDDVGGKNATIEIPNIQAWFKEYGPRMGQIRRANKNLAEALDRINQEITKTGQGKLGDINEAFSNLWATWRKLGRREFAGAKAAIGKFKEMAIADFQAMETATGTPIFSRYMEAETLQRLGHSIDRAKFVEGLFNKAMRYNEETGEYIFQPVQFKKVVETNYQNIINRFGKRSEVPDLLMEYANKMEGAARDLATYTKASKTGTTEEILKLGLYGPGGYIGGIPGVAVPMGFNTVMAHSLAHPRGYMKRFLFRETPGAFLEKFGKEATRTGIMWLPREEEKRIKSPEQ